MEILEHRFGQRTTATPRMHVSEHTLVEKHSGSSNEHLDRREVRKHKAKSRWVVRAFNAGFFLAAGLLCRMGSAAEPANDSSQPSTGKHCRGSSHTKLLLTDAVVATTNPIGGENELFLGVCSPLIREPGPLFDYTNVQAGLLNYFNPASVQQGAYFSITPLSILELRTDAAWVSIWPFPFDGAGYFPLTSYDASYRANDLPAARADSAHGVTVTATGTLQGEVRVASRLSVVAQNAFGVEYWNIGTAAFYYNLRNAIALAKSDYILVNRSSLLMGFDLSNRVDVKAGANFELTVVPEGSYSKSVLSGLAVLSLKNWPTPGSSEAGSFLRVGAYTAHPCMSGLVLLAGMYATFDLVKYD